MAFSDFLARRWWAVALALAAAALGSALLLRLPRVRRTADRALLGAPLLGPLLRRYNLAQLSRTISLLLASGVRIVGALEVASAGNGNAAYRAALAEAATEVAKGRDLSAALAGRPRLFPGLFLSMAAVGERAGDLPGALSHLSRMYADELEASAKRFSTLLEPGLMMAMGLLVGFIAVAIIAPIYGITERLSPGGF